MNPTILSWTPTGEMKFKNKVIPGSNIASLVKDYIYPMKQARPYGWENLATAFDEMETPQKKKPVLVRSRAATSGKVVPGRPSKRRSTAHSMATRGALKRSLRSWQHY